MVIAYHGVFSAYGFWLPNDPRGSGSTFVASPELLKFGKATRVGTRQSVAHKQHDSNLRKAAKAALKYPPVRFNGFQARAIARGFEQAIVDAGYIIHACCILPDHAHLVVANHTRKIETIIGHFKAAATRQLSAEQLHPFGNGEDRPSPWGAHGWNVFLNSAIEIRKKIKYVEDNPSKEGKQRQIWGFVTLYDE